MLPEQPYSPGPAGFRAALRFRLLAERVFYGPGPHKLLELTRELGSLSEACRCMGISYTKGRKLISTMEQQLGASVIETRQGGKGGGFSHLTPRARDLMARYSAFCLEAENVLQALFQKHFAASAPLGFCGGTAERNLTMEGIFTQILYELEKGHDMSLVTIISQDGSSPRGLGAQMLAGSQGRILGTVGGGAVEQRCTDAALLSLTERRSFSQNFSLRQDGAESIGMVCGGDVTAWFQFIDAQDPQWADLSSQLLTALSQHRTGWLALCLDGAPPFLVQTGEGVPGLEPGRCLQTGIRFYLPLPARERAVIFGGGHCAQALVPLLSRVGFRVTVVDSRSEYAAQALFPQAETVICGDYLHISQYLELTPSDYVVIMTSGHSFDYEVQRQVLQHPPAYVGVIGSRSKAAFINQKLRQDGLPEETIGSVHTPIGTEIKAVTPEEIAVSIAGEMIYERALLRERAHNPAL